MHHPTTRHTIALALPVILLASLGPAQAQPLGQRLRSAWGRVTGRSAASTANATVAAANPAADSQPQACQARLRQLAESKGWKHEMKGNVLYLAVPSEAKDSYLKACGQNVIEFWKEPKHGTYHHLYTRLGGTNWSRIWSLSGHDWYVPSTGVGVLSALEPSVADRTREFLKENSRNPTSGSNRYGTIGEFNVSGGGGGANGKTHCTNYWECAKVGDNGETMPKLHGMWGTGIAPGWISSLMRSSSPRVFAVAVYGQTDLSDSALRKFFE